MEVEKRETSGSKQIQQIIIASVSLPHSLSTFMKHCLYLSLGIIILFTTSISYLHLNIYMHNMYTNHFPTSLKPSGSTRIMPLYIYIYIYIPSLSAVKQPPLEYTYIQKVLDIVGFYLMLVPGIQSKLFP